MKFRPRFITEMKDLAEVLTEKTVPYDPNREYTLEDLEDIAVAMRDVEREIMRARKVRDREVAKFDGVEYVLFAMPPLFDSETLEKLIGLAADEGFDGRFRIVGSGFWVEL